MNEAERCKTSCLRVSGRARMLCTYPLKTGTTQVAQKVQSWEEEEFGSELVFCSF